MCLSLPHSGPLKHATITLRRKRAGRWGKLRARQRKRNGMPGPRPAKIELSDETRQRLEILATRYTTGQQKSQRVRIILKAAESKNHTEIATELKVSVDMATLWRKRRLAARTPAYRTGRFERRRTPGRSATSRRTAAFHGRSGLSDGADGL